MSAAVSIESGVLDDYRARLTSDAVDELATPTGLRGDQAALGAAVDAMGMAGLLAARAEARNFAADEGITYGTGTPGGRRWAIDPIPVLLGAAEWQELERGLDQRARLLDLVLSDLYGERTLLRRRVIPPELILAHDGYVRQTAGIAAPGPRQLVVAATDLGRDPQGRWTVISDRTQAPSGPGYAMATRRIISQVMAGLHRSVPLARLRGFFQTFTAALQDASPSATEPPRVVLLTPGPNSETAFEQAYLATLLGFPLVEADDLVMHQGRVWLQAGDRLEQVDVVLRRVDAAFADPLELRGDSQLGVPGLIEATRTRTVAVVNPIGAGVLENPGLVAHLPDVARVLLDEDLLLPSPTTWWCGRGADRSHVLANLDALVIKPISRATGPLRYGWQLTAQERGELADRIAAEPWAWCAQEPLQLSTAPVVTHDGLEPRRFVLRTFGVAHDNGYRFLPGGLGRVAGQVSEHTVSNYAGALAKDVWVISADAEQAAPAVRDRALGAPPVTRTAGLTPRVSDNLFWMGRYAERAEGTARLLKVVDDFAEDNSSQVGTPGALATGVLLHAVARVTSTPTIGSSEPSLDYLRRVVLDDSRAGTVRHCANRLIGAAQHVRDLLSVDTWAVLGRLQKTLDDPPDDDDQLQPLLADVLESLLALAGIMAQSMVRDESWAFLDAGCRMERAQLTLALLGSALTEPRDRGVLDLVVEGVLRAGESIITHRRRAAAGTGTALPLESAIDLLLLDRRNPRSVLYQAESLVADLTLLGDEASVAKTLAIVQTLRTVEPADSMDAAALAERLAGLEQDFRRLSDDLAALHFSRQAPRRPQTSGWASPWQVADD
ncbi:MAG: circularly permuted type 2 ATP-grasp protein [Micropruina sp.]|uniref:circularly permuted type 2 ATP-grasp protein n=1 Tax=Micropruina sp. TaxID=2737536 RepID=UPI0039E502B5